MRFPFQFVVFIVVSDGTRNSGLMVANCIPVSSWGDLKRAIKQQRERKDDSYIVPGVYFK